MDAIYISDSSKLLSQEHSTREQFVLVWVCTVYDIGEGVIKKNRAVQKMDYSLQCLSKNLFDSLHSPRCLNCLTRMSLCLHLAVFDSRLYRPVASISCTERLTCNTGRLEEIPTKTHDRGRWCNFPSRIKLTTGGGQFSISNITHDWRVGGALPPGR